MQKLDIRLGFQLNWSLKIVGVEVVAMAKMNFFIGGVAGNLSSIT
jgi:hypothetical protein